MFEVSDNETYSVVMNVLSKPWWVDVCMLFITVLAVCTGTVNTRKISYFRQWSLMENKTEWCDTVTEGEAPLMRLGVGKHFWISGVFSETWMRRKRRSCEQLGKEHSRQRELHVQRFPRWGEALRVCGTGRISEQRQHGVISGRVSGS